MIVNGAHAADSDREYVYQILPGVSRTFALTIPELPVALRDLVADAYLLCRIADTIEDEPSLAAAQKARYLEELCASLSGSDEPGFCAELAAQLGPDTLPAERELIRNAGRVVRLAWQFEPRQLAAVQRCLTTMSRGMHHYQRNRSAAGLNSMRELDHYCYCVAGVVGEMLTELFCDYSPLIDRHRRALLQLAASFGQGLQMTNVLADTWEDLQHGVCWLPRDLFEAVGFDLGRLSTQGADPRFREGICELVGVAHAHLRSALRYTLMIPAGETGIRKFLLWAIGLAVMTLRRIASNPGFSTRSEVKVSRRTVKTVVLASSALVRSNVLLSRMFRIVTRPLPLSDAQAVGGPQAA